MNTYCFILTEDFAERFGIATVSVRSTSESLAWVAFDRFTADFAAACRAVSDVVVTHEGTN